MRSPSVVPRGKLPKLSLLTPRLCSQLLPTPPNFVRFTLTHPRLLLRAPGALFPVRTNSPKHKCVASFGVSRTAAAPGRMASVRPF